MQATQKFQYKTPFIVALSVIIGMLVGMRMQRNMAHKGQNNQDKLNELIARLKQYYVDDINVDSIAKAVSTSNSKIIDSLEISKFQSILAALDPHSVYLPAAILKYENEDMKGAFAGVGIEYTIVADTVRVMYVVPNGPAQKAGVEKGDKIISISDSVVTGKLNNPDKLRKLFRGEPNSTVQIQILRNQQTLVKKIIRGMVDLPSIDAYFMLTKNVGYIKLSKFSLTSHTEFKQALTALKKEGMQSLIFDLRDNGGGIMTDAIKIIDEFVAGKTLLTYTQGAKDKRKEYFSGNDGDFEQGKVSIIINEGSASAAEVVAGSLQDLDRATIIGRRSFGKGLVQQQFGFTDKSAVRITVARYYIPSGRCIQKPYNQGKVQYDKDIHTRYMQSELFNADSAKLDKSKTYKTSQGRTVYGGGGIMPDVFVPLDTSANKILSAIHITQNTNYYFQFANEYFINNLSILKNYKDAADFNARFTIDETCWLGFLAFLQRENAKYSFNKSEAEYAKSALKKNIARVAFRLSGYYQVSATTDKEVKQALLNMQ